jgi:hypothetical protein
MKFLKENSYDIIKLFINQVGIAIFATVLYTAIGDIEDVALRSGIRVAISAFAVFFYFALLYTVCWEYGAKDKIRIDGGKAERTPMKGALMSLFANLPNFTLTGIAIICLLIAMNGGAVGFKAVFSILNLVFGLLESIYTGIVTGIVPVAESASAAVQDMAFLYRSVLYMVLPVFSIVVCQLGYAFGEREIRIFSFKGRKSK